MDSLGKEARDKITGLKGIIVGKIIYLTGCNQYGICPPAKDGKVNDTYWVDTGRVEIIGHGVDLVDVKDEHDGGPSLGPSHW